MTALGDFSSGDILTAADMNAIGAWTTYTPTISSGSGTPTTVTANAKYVRLNEIVIVRVRIDITDKGTAGGSVEFTLPVTAAGSNANALYGRETVATGNSLNGEVLASNTEAAIRQFSNGSPWVNGYGLAVTLIYEAA